MTINATAVERALAKVEFSRQAIAHEALDVLNKLAVDLRKSDPKLTKEQAFAKVRAANPELRRIEKFGRLGVS